MDQDVLRQGVFLALQRPRNVANPYPLYHGLRRAAPFHWDFVLSGWFLTRYADIAAALADPRLSTENFSFDVSQLPPDLQSGLAPLGRVRKREALYNNAPEHERLRRPLNRAFGPGSFERARPGMESLAEELLRRAGRLPSIDLVRDYSEPLADYIVCELLGLPGSDRATFIAHCDCLRTFVTMPRMGRETVLKAKEAVRSFEAIRSYVGTMIAARRDKFFDDVIGQSLAVEPHELPPTEEEILANCVFFLHAGGRNMSASITNAILALLTHPKELARLRDDPGLLTVAIEELQRFETPVQVAIRGVPEKIEFCGRQIGPRQLLFLLLGAANRDPEQFADPDRLDLRRRPNRHLSFGIGAHGCIGAWMARFGMAIAIGAILQQRANFRLATSTLTWIPPAIRRMPRELPVTLTRGANRDERSRLNRTRQSTRKSGSIAKKFTDAR